MRQRTPAPTHYRAAHQAVPRETYLQGAEELRTIAPYRSDGIRGQAAVME